MVHGEHAISSGTAIIYINLVQTQTILVIERNTFIYFKQKSIRDGLVTYFHLYHTKLLIQRLLSFEYFQRGGATCELSNHNCCVYDYNNFILAKMLTLKLSNYFVMRVTIYVNMFSFVQYSKNCQDSIDCYMLILIQTWRQVWPHAVMESNTAPRDDQDFIIPIS